MIVIMLIIVIISRLIMMMTLKAFNLYWQFQGLTVLNKHTVVHHIKSIFILINAMSVTYNNHEQ